MKKRNKCPMCGVHQLIEYSSDLIIDIESAFKIQHESSLRTQKKRDGLYEENKKLKDKCSIFDELVGIISGGLQRRVDKSMPFLEIISGEESERILSKIKEL